MSAEAKLDVKISADGTQAKAEVQGVARAVQDATGAMARAYASVSVQIRSVSAAVSGFQKALGIWNQVAVAIDATVKIIQKGLGVIRNFGKASEEAGEKAGAAFKAASDAGLDASLYDAVKSAAAAAGVSADELSEKLKAFREHKITFGELASSIESTGRALESAASAADARTVGTRFLAREKSRRDAEKEYGDAAALEREGLRTIANRIIREGDAYGRGGRDVERLWDLVMEAAGGDRACAGRVFNENVSWFAPHRVGGAMYGGDALRDAESRYARRRADPAAIFRVLDRIARRPNVDNMSVPLGAT